MTKIIARLKPYKWVVRWTVFLLVLAHLFIAASYILRPLNTPQIIHMGFYEIDYALDVVCIGASSTHSYWAPLHAWEEYGIASSNLTSSGLIMEGMLPLLKEALNYQTPELIVIDLRVFYNTEAVYSETKVRWTIDSMDYSLNRTQLVLDVVPEQLAEGEENTLFYYLFDIAKYHDNWKTLDSNDLSTYNNTRYHYLKGYLRSTATDAELIDFADYSDNITATAPTEYTLSLFMELLDYASTIDSEILFVVSPYNETEEARELYNYYETLILESGMGYLNANDFREEMDIVDASSNFYNENHVNIFGAEKYTSFLGEYITTNYDIPDRREDESYDFWNEEYLIWEQVVADTKEYILNILNGTTE